MSDYSRESKEGYPIYISESLLGLYYSMRITSVGNSDFEKAMYFAALSLTVSLSLAGATKRKVPYENLVEGSPFHSKVEYKRERAKALCANQKEKG